MLTLSRLFTAILLGLLFALPADPSMAQSYPSRTIRIIVPFPAASVSDIVARTVGQKLSGNLGQPVVVDNRAGASGIIGSEAVAKAAPDGYTLLVGTISTHGINPGFFAKLPYNVEKDFIAISEIATTPNVVVVNAALPAKSIKEFVALARAKGSLSYATGGSGSGPHLCGELLKSMAGINLLQVPYKGAPESYTAVLGNEVAMTIQSIASALPLIKAGRLRALAVTSLQRSPMTPDVPTMIEEGFAGYDFTSWSGIFAPAGTPREIVARLYREIVKAVQSQDVRDSLAAQGGMVVGSSPEQFAAKVNAEIAKWGQVMKDAGVKPQ